MAEVGHSVRLIMKQSESPVKPQANSILNVLGELRKGEIVSEASSELHRVIEQTMKLGKPGEVTIKLKIEKRDDESIEIVGAVDGKAAKPSPKVTTFFVGEDGALSRNDPKQQEMFQTVDGGRKEIVEPTAVAVNE